MRGRLTVGLWILDPSILVRVQAPQQAVDNESHLIGSFLVK